MSKPFKIKERIKSFRYAGKGIYSFIAGEHNAWIHCSAILVVTCAGFFLNITREEWIAVILCYGLVLTAEAFNTAIERLVDLVSPEQHPIAGNVKDIAAGAVLISAIIAFIVGLIVFIPYII